MFESEIANAFAGGLAILVLGAIALKMLAWFLTPNEDKLKEVATLKKRMADRTDVGSRVRH